MDEISFGLNKTGNNIYIYNPLPKRYGGKENALLLSAYCVDSIDRRKTGLTVLDLGEIIVSAQFIHKLGQLQSNLETI